MNQSEKGMAKSAFHPFADNFKIKEDTLDEETKQGYK